MKTNLSRINREALEAMDAIRFRVKRGQESRDAGAAVSMRFDHGRHAHLYYTVTHCLEAEGLWRVTRWDDEGPLGHTAQLDADGVVSELYVLGARA